MGPQAVDLIHRDEPQLVADACAHPKMRFGALDFGPLGTAFLRVLLASTLLLALLATLTTWDPI